MIGKFGRTDVDVEISTSETVIFRNHREDIADVIPEVNINYSTLLIGGYSLNGSLISFIHIF